MSNKPLQSIKFPGLADTYTIENDIENFASAYSTSSTYQVGEYVTYDGAFYVCTTAISTVEAWTPAHWSQVTVGEELSEYKAEINQTIQSINIIEGILAGAFSGSALTIATSYYATAIYFPVVIGEKYTIVKPQATSYWRVGYSTSVPDIGTTLTNYDSSASTSALYATYTAPITGYLVAYIASGNATTKPVFDKEVYAYKGEYNSEFNAYTSNLININKINGIEFGSVKTDIDQLQNDKADIIFSNASGTVASFTDGAEYDAVGLTAEFAPYQEGTGDPSPENIRPIHGWTGLDILTSGEDTSDSTTTPISWQTEAGEVFGGYVDAVRGKVVATYGRKVVNTESTFIRTWSDGYYPYYMRTTLSGLKYGSGVNILGDSIPYKTKTELDSGVTCFYRPSTSQTNIYWIAPGCSTEEGATALRSSGYVFVYELETPIEYDIDPVTIELLKGYNNVWTNAGGNVDVTYRADTKLYIDGKQLDIRNTIAPIEDGTTASQAYAIGKYFYRNGSFCKAKTAIASGAAFTLGTNYEVTTVSAELFTALS